MNLARCLPAVSLVAIAIWAGCNKDKEQPQVAVAASSAMPASGPAAGQARFVVAPGSTCEFLIDAPLEKIKGSSARVSGTIDLDPKSLKSSKASFEVDLDDLKTETFPDAAKNASQTEHMKNWFEIGPDVEPKLRAENRRARFALKSIDRVSASSLADAPESNGQRNVTMTVSGDLSLHGASSPKTVDLVLTFAGPASDPALVHLVTSQPLKVSLKEHDIKPRDLAGKFVAGALEKVGQKIDDTVLISLDLKAAK